MSWEKLKESIRKTAKSLWNSFPILLGVIILVSLIHALLPKEGFSALFKGGIVIQSLIGSILGSILAGNPVTSYVLGGELLKAGISLIPITAFIVAWVTVGIVQLPAEAMLLGKRFAISRNITAFIFSIIVAIITVFLVGLL
ncbi:permease [Candidatus Woesearchaeota archaeon]|nr:permease [Candidatus Woesearchaeota archaeon]